jgi:AAA15 family ATPase/GTPase
LLANNERDFLSFVIDHIVQEDQLVLKEIFSLMIINFRVKNFLSFREEVEFTALATLERQHRGRIFQSKSLHMNLLPIAAFYGGNGAGKSNLYHALRFARDLVLRAATKPEDAINREPFRLDSACLIAPSRFGFDLLLGECCLRYEFAVTAKSVVSEDLGFLDGDTVKPIYRRRQQEGKDWWDPESFSGLKFSEEDREFVRFKTRDTLENQLFLSSVRGRKLPTLEELGRWFSRQLILLDPHSDFRPVEEAMHVEEFKSYCIESLDKAGTGIDGMQNEPIAIESLPIPEKLRERVMKQLESDKDDQLVLLRGRDRTRFLLRSRNGIIEAFRLMTYHKGADGKRIAFEIPDESEGTERMIDLLPAFFELTSPHSNKVFFIDELDRSLHTHLTRGLMESFLESRTSESRAQLLFTTHDPLLLDQELLRRDEIWFIDKLEDGHSKLSALSDFKGVRYDKDIRKNYLLGRFAGVPTVRRLPRRNLETVPTE